jgi:hypothetical protein
MSKDDHQPIDYKTHILVGVRAGGVMTVIADWPYVPPQSEVQQEIDCTREPYVTFLLCTPTSIMPAERDTRKAPKATPSRFGSPLPVRRR